MTVVRLLELNNCYERIKTLRNILSAMKAGKAVRISIDDTPIDGTLSESDLQYIIYKSEQFHGDMKNLIQTEFNRLEKEFEEA